MVLYYYIDQPELLQSLTLRYCTDYFWASPTCIYGLPDGPEPLRVVVVVEEEPAAEVLVGRPRPGGVGRGLSLPQSVVPPQELTVKIEGFYTKVALNQGMHTTWSSIMSNTG